MKTFDYIYFLDKEINFNCYNNKIKEKNKSHFNFKNEIINHI